MPYRTLSPSDPAIVWSPWNWDILPSGAAQSVHPGAWCRLGFGGKNLVLNTDVSSYVSLDAEDAPRILYRIDLSPWRTLDLSPTESRYTLAEDLEDAPHTLFLLYESHNPERDVWQQPEMRLCITRFEIDAHAETFAPSVPNRRILLFGNSISYGIATGGAGASHRERHSAFGTLLFPLQSGLRAQLGIVGFGAQDYGKAGLGNVPAIEEAWAWHTAGRSRLKEGALSPIPDAILLLHGTAGRYAPPESIFTGCRSLLEAVRNAAPQAPILLCLPPGRHHEEALSQAFAAYQNERPDPNAFWIDFGAEMQAGLKENATGATYRSPDGIHLNPMAYGEWAGAFLRQVLPILS